MKTIHIFNTPEAVEAMVHAYIPFYLAESLRGQKFLVQEFLDGHALVCGRYIPRAAYKIIKSHHVKNKNRRS